MAPGENNKGTNPCDLRLCYSVVPRDGIEPLPTKEIKNIVAFAIYSGLRQEAILDLKIEDVVFYDSGSISRVLVKDKGGEKEERILSRQAT